MSSQWDGALDASVLNPSYVETVGKLADAAKAGDWEAVFRYLDADKELSANRWRIGGTSWFTPLHQMAWHGAPVDVVERLIRRGAWRTLRNAAGEHPLDIALSRGHVHLQEALTPPEVASYELKKHEAWDRHFQALVAERTQHLQPVRMRPLPTELFSSKEVDFVWFPYPGMYGGFVVTTHRGRLCVESWSRVSGGSGQAHVITEGGCVMVEEGFV